MQRGFTMKRNMALVLIIIVISSLFTGCWGKRELNELSIATGIGIDKKDGKYIVTVQLMNPSEIAIQKSSGQRTPSVVYKAEGRNIFEAIRRMTKKLSRKVYLAHVRVVIFGEKVAREGIGNSLDFLSRNNEMRSNVYMLVARGDTAENVLSVLSVMEKMGANKIYDSLKTSEEAWAATRAVKLDDLINCVVNKGKDPVMTGIFVNGDVDMGKNKENIQKSKPDAVLSLDHIAAFKKDKLIGWLTETESIGYNEIMGNLKSTLVTIDSIDGGNLGIEITSAKSTVKGKVKDGKPQIQINLQAIGNVGESQSTMDLTELENISKIERATENKLEKNMKAAIERAQKDLESDIFGFGESIHISNPKEWKNLKENWSEEFKNLPTSINVNVTIKGLGTITKPVPQEMRD